MDERTHFFKVFEKYDKFLLLLFWVVMELSFILFAMSNSTCFSFHFSSFFSSSLILPSLRYEETT